MQATHNPYLQRAGARQAGWLEWAELLIMGRIDVASRFRRVTSLVSTENRCLMKSDLVHRGGW